MSKLTILIDMDDTIENLTEVWTQKLNNAHNLSVSINDIKEWDMTKAFPTLSSEEVFRPLRDSNLWDEVKPKKGAVEYIDKMIHDGHDIFIVTASHPDTVSPKINKVIFKYFPFIDYENIIVSYKKQMIIGDVLIDDAPHNLEGGYYAKILFSAPHNLKYDADKNSMIRVNSWEEVYDWINIISEYKNKR